MFGVEASHWAASFAWPVGNCALRQHTRVPCLVRCLQACQRLARQTETASPLDRPPAGGGEQVDAQQDHAGLL